MSKQKIKKSLLKRLKITSKDKILRKHQFGAGHLKRNKSKGAKERQRKTIEFFKGESKRLRKIIGL